VSSLLIVIVDTHPSQFIVEQGPETLLMCFDSIVSFCNCHLMLSADNKLAVIAYHTSSSEFLYPSTSPREESPPTNHDGRLEMFSKVEDDIRLGLRNMTKKSAQDGLTQNALCPGALARALCYIHRLNTEKPTGTKLSSRILVVTSGSDCASQYMNFMNSFFTAQKQGVTIDACILGGEATLLHQGCDITGGTYLKINQLSGLLQYLFWVFLPDPLLRSKLVLPPSARVDYRAACFCHRDLIDIGYVCSVCLSVFCKFSPICITCQTVFSAPVALPKKGKKKKAIQK